MKNKRTEIIGYILCFVVAVLLIVFCKQVDVLSWVVIVLGIIFVVPSLVSLVALCIPPKDKNAPRMWYMLVPATAGIILGFLMICKPDTFINLLTWFFAIVLIVFGIYQMAVEIASERDFNTSRYLLIAPILITVTGIVIVCIGPDKIKELCALVTGIALLIYSINGIVAFLHLMSRKRQMQLLNQSVTDDVKGHKEEQKEAHKPEAEKGDYVAE